MRQKTNLTAILSEAANGQHSAKNVSAVFEKPIGASVETAKNYRAGRVNVTGYFVPAVKASMRAIQTKHPALTQQDLLAEALNDLFAKYDVPQTAYLKP